MTENSTLISEEPPGKSPHLLRNYISFVGGAITIAALASLVLLFLVEITSKNENPYLGILTYIIFPSFLFFGLFVILVGGTCLLEPLALRAARVAHRISYLIRGWT